MSRGPFHLHGQPDGAPGGPTRLIRTATERVWRSGGAAGREMSPIQDLWLSWCNDGPTLCGRFAGTEPGGVTAVSGRVQTLLCTDIVGSTARLRDLGDAAWAALLNRHHEVIRAVLAGHGGRGGDTAGDGLLAGFDAPALALRAALAAVAAV